MGSFDTVRFRCPLCSTPIRIQTKAGNCSLAIYSLHDLPPVVAGALHGESVNCRQCESVLVFHTSVLVSVFVADEDESEGGETEAIEL